MTSQRLGRPRRRHDRPARPSSSSRSCSRSPRATASAPEASRRAGRRRRGVPARRPLRLRAGVEAPDATRSSSARARPARRSCAKLAGYLRARLPRGRYESVPGHPGLRNVVGRIPGSKPAVVLAAHYDTKDLPGFVGANDGAGGTAAVLEIARALRKLERPRGAPEIRFVFFDGEEATDDSRPFEETGAARLEGLRASATPTSCARSCCSTSSRRRARCGSRARRSSDAAAVAPPARRGQARRRRARVPATALVGEVTDDHTPFLRTRDPGDRPDRLHVPLLAQDLRRPVRGLRALARPLGRGRLELLRTLALAWVACPSRSSCSPLRAATAPASTAPCRPSSARSSCTARPVYVRKEIVHNKHVVAQLRERGGDLRGRARRHDPRGRRHRVLRPRRLAGRPRRRRAPLPAHDRRDLPAGDQGPPRGGEVRRRRLHDRADRPRRPRGGRGHDGGGARAHRARRDRGRRRRAARSRTPSASPTSPRPRCRSTRRARSSPACARSSPASRARAPTTSVTRRPTARRPSSRWPRSATWCS